MVGADFLRRRTLPDKGRPAWDYKNAVDIMREKAIREETDLIRSTTKEELAYIANRAAEARMAGGAGGSGSAATNVGEAVEDELVDEALEGPIGGQEALAGEQGDETAEEQVHKEPPVPPVPAKKTRTLRKAASGVHPPSGDEVAAKGAAAKAIGRQGSGRQAPQQQ